MNPEILALAERLKLAVESVKREQINYRVGKTKAFFTLDRAISEMALSSNLLIESFKSFEREKSEKI